MCRRATALTGPRAAFAALMIVTAATGTWAFAQRGPRPPQAWAVVIGVGDYLDPLITDSREAVRDATTVRGWLVQSAGWAPEHVLFLTDRGSNNPGTPAAPRPEIRPTRANLEWAFRDWLASRKVGPGDVVLIYFAGRVEKPATPGGGGGLPAAATPMLLPLDAGLGDVANTGWSLERAVDRLVLETGGRAKVLCLLATSASGIRRAGQPVTVPGNAEPAGKEWLSRLCRWPGVSAWLASGRPSANPAIDEPSSAFTRVLLNAMGPSPRKGGLSVALAALQSDPTLKRQGLRSAGMIPPGLSLHADALEKPPGAQAPDVILQLGHADRVTAIATTPDGQRAITASKDSTLRVWSIQEGTLQRTLTGHEVGVNTLALSHDGRWLVSGGARSSNALLVHDLQAPLRRVVPEQIHERGVERVTLLPDRDHFVSVDADGRGRLWDLRESPPSTAPWLDGIDIREVVVGGGVADGRVAVLCGDRSVRVLNASGAGEPSRKSWEARPTALAIDRDGKRVAVGFEDGRYVVQEIANGNEQAGKAPAGPIHALAFLVEGRLAITHGGGLSLPKAAGLTANPLPVLDAEARGPFQVAPDGRALAVSMGDDLGLKVWQVDDGQAEPRAVLNDPKAESAALAFTSDGQAVVAGGATGAVRVHPLGDGAKEAAWTRPPHRAKVRQVLASPGRRHLLLLNDLGEAMVWDLRERNCRRLPGAWTSAAFTGADERLALTEFPGAERPGRVVSLTLDGGQVDARPQFFQRQSGDFKVPEDAAFLGVTATADGTRIAAMTNPSQMPLVCVWDTATGKLTHWIEAEGLGGRVEVLSLSPDGRSLLTAGDGPEARLWDLSASPGQPKAPALTLRPEGDGVRRVTAAAIRPGGTRQVAIGHADGNVRLWTWRDGQAEPAASPVVVIEGYYAGAVKALTFANDGKADYLAAAGDGTSLWVGRFEGPRVQRVDPGPRPHHAEQVNTLAAWPPGPAPAPTADPKAAPTAIAARALLISGSDDATLKLWNLDAKALALRGTFSPSAVTGGPRDAGGPAEDLDWVLYTPDGQFDASPGGREVVRFLHGDRARPMEQLDATPFYAFDLGEQLLDPRPPTPIAGLEEPPAILVESAKSADPNDPEAQVSVLIGPSDVTDVRLYHNNVPVATGLEAAIDPSEPDLPRRVRVPVRLVSGRNRFHAMAAARSDVRAFESRSPELDLDFNGKVEPGRLHVLALGVGDYRRQRLKFAGRDAQRISEAFHDRGPDVAGERGLRLVRTDADVNVQGVDADFRQLAKVARPQDTVVVFLAGHTGVFGDNRFCLLLPTYPFPTQAPTLAMARDAFMSRDAPAGAADSPHVLPYSAIEANLMRIKALNRLVIVDACQAESIFDDAQVRQIRRWMEVRSRRARTSYLMAARRGEPALEFEGLQHGLFTYALLRGMGDAVDPEREPEEIARIVPGRDADFNGDGVISTGELDDFARKTLPGFARVFPNLVSRSLDLARRTRPDLPRLSEKDLGQGLRLQGASLSFDLFPVAKGP